MYVGGGGGGGGGVGGGGDRGWEREKCHPFIVPQIAQIIIVDAYESFGYYRD